MRKDVERSKLRLLRHSQIRHSVVFFQSSYKVGSTLVQEGDLLVCMTFSSFHCASVLGTGLDCEGRYSSSVSNDTCAFSSSDDVLATLAVRGMSSSAFCA